MGRPPKLVDRSPLANGLPGLTDLKAAKVAGMEGDAVGEMLLSRMGFALADGKVPLRWPGSDWLTTTAGGSGASSARSTMSDA